MNGLPRPEYGPPAGVSELIDAAREAERDGRHSVARSRFVAALHRLRGSGQAALSSALTRWIGRTHGDEGDNEAALDCYEAALAIAEACASVVDAAHAVNWKANVAFGRGRLDEATELYHLASSMAEDGEERRLMAMIDQNLGNVANIRGDREEAMDRYKASLAEYRELGVQECLGPLLNNIGMLQTDLGEFSEAESSFEQALISCDGAKDRTGKVLVLVNRTRLCLAENDLVRARDHSDAALDMSTQLGEERWLGEIHKNYGVLFREAKRHALAEESLNRALSLAQKGEDLLLEAEVNRELADLFRHQHRNCEVLECLTRAQMVFGELRARPGVADVDRQIARLEAEFLRVVQDWGESIESKDRYTQGHCVRVADYAAALALAAGLDPASLVWFKMGALLHDLGKVTVPEHILNKAGQLTDEEWAEMKRHPEAGAEMLAEAEFPWDIRPMVLHHHERWDGKGYPHGIAGEEIPLSARILCVADVFDALTTTRSYRSALSSDVAMEIMEGDAGHVFDPELFAIFKERLPSILTTRQRGATQVESFPALPSSGAFSAVKSQRRPPVRAVA